MKDDTDKNWWVWALLLRWRLLFFGSIIIAVAVLGITFLLPKWYFAEAEVMPLYRSSEGFGSMANLAGGILSFGGGGGDYVLPMMMTPSDLWEGIVKSNAVADKLIEKFGLDVRYKIDIREKARAAVIGHLKTEITGEGILKVGFEDKSPEFAAQVANGIVDELDYINRNFRTGSAGATRQFIEERLNETGIALAKSESLLVEFQKNKGAISIEDQTRIAIESAAQLRTELLLSQVELGTLSTSRKPGNAEVADVRKRIELLQVKLDEVKTGDGKNEPFGLVDIPDLAIEYAHLLREVTIQQILYEYLVQQFEQARIEEKKNTPVLQVLSRAQAPEKKVRPKKVIISGLSFFAGFIILSIWVLGCAGLDRMKENNADNYQRLVRILSLKMKK